MSIYCFFNRHISNGTSSYTMYNNIATYIIVKLINEQHGHMDRKLQLNINYLKSNYN